MSPGPSGSSRTAFFSQHESVSCLPVYLRLIAASSAQSSLSTVLSGTLQLGRETCQRAMRQAGAATPARCQNALAGRMALACGLRAAGQRPNVFGPDGPSADHKLIDLKATNGELLRCG